MRTWTFNQSERSLHALAGDDTHTSFMRVK